MLNDRTWISQVHPKKKAELQKLKLNKQEHGRCIEVLVFLLGMLNIAYVVTGVKNS